jgi:hypothetical protein
LILETFEAKKAQLDTVIQCAKTWKFPLDGGKWELVWEGKLEDATYQYTRAEKHRRTSERSNHDEEVEFSDSDNEGGWYDGEEVRSWTAEDSTVVVRIIRFRRARVY